MPATPARCAHTASRTRLLQLLLLLRHASPNLDWLSTSGRFCTTTASRLLPTPSSGSGVALWKACSGRLTDGDPRHAPSSGQYCLPVAARWRTRTNRGSARGWAPSWWVSFLRRSRQPIDALLYFELFRPVRGERNKCEAGVKLQILRFDTL